MVGAVTLVMLSVLDTPLSGAAARSGVLGGAAVVSSVKVREVVPVLPAVSVSVATMVWLPSARVGVNDQWPLASAVVVPMTVLPSLKVTTALASPAPVRVASLVMRSLLDAPLSLLSASVTAGGGVSMVTLSGADAVLVLPAISVSLAVSVWVPSLSVELTIDQLPLASATA